MPGRRDVLGRGRAGRGHGGGPASPRLARRCGVRALGRGARRPVGEAPRVPGNRRQGRAGLAAAWLAGERRRPADVLRADAPQGAGAHGAV